MINQKKYMFGKNINIPITKKTSLKRTKFFEISPKP